MAATLEEELENYRRTGRFSAGVEADPVASFLAKELPSTPFPMRKPPEPDAASVSSGVLASPYVPDEIDDWRRTGSFKRLVSEDPAAAFVAANQPADEADVSTGVLADDRPFPTRVASAAVAPQTPAQRAVVKAPDVAAPSFEIMKPDASPFGLQENRKDLQFALGGGPSLDFLKGRAGVAAQAEQEKQRFVARAGQAGGEPAKAPVPARTANAATGTTVSGDVAKKAPAMDDGKAAKPVVGVGVPSAGAGGDEGIDRTALAEALARGGEAIFRGVTGRALPTGIPEMLAAVRQRREAQAQRERELGAEQAREEARASRAEQLESVKAARLAETERQTNAAYAESLKRLYPEEAAAGVFDGLEEAAGKPQFAAIARALESRLRGKVERPLIEARAATEKEKPAQIQATTRLKNAQAKKLETLGLGAQRDVGRGAKEIKDIAPEGKPITPYQQTQIETKLAGVATSKAFKGAGELANDLAELERIAPGSTTRGVVPDWLTTEQMLAWQEGKRIADPRVRDFMTAFGRMRNVKRHEQYGSALNAGEIRASLQEISDRPIESGPNVFVGQLASMRKAAAKKAANDYRPYFNTSAKDSVDRILIQGTGADKHFGKGGIYEDAGTWYTPSGAGPSTAKVRIRRKSDGVVRSLSREQADVLLKDAGFEEVR